MNDYIIIIKGQQSLCIIEKNVSIKNKCLFHNVFASRVKFMNISLKQTCFDAHSEKNMPCRKKECKNWINCKNSNNCVLLAAKSGPRTLQEVGDIFNLTRMRICQIEKNIFNKIKSDLK